MKKLILFLIIYLVLFVLAMNLDAQPIAEKVYAIKISENVIELRAKFIDSFPILKSLPNNNQRLNELKNTTSDLGFIYKTKIDSVYETFNIPIGKVNSFKEGLDGEDTLVISSTLTNAPKNENYYARVIFNPKNDWYKFSQTGEEAINTRFSDKACEPIIEYENASDRKVNVDDTVTITINAVTEDFCANPISYSWEYATYDVVSGTDTMYSDWKNWTASRSGSISINNGEVIFKVMNRNWDNRKWRCRVYNNIGEVYSKQYKIKVNQ